MKEHCNMTPLKDAGSNRDCRIRACIGFFLPLSAQTEGISVSWRPGGGTVVNSPGTEQLEQPPAEV